MKERDLLGDLGIDGNIKWVFNKYDGMMWTGWI
jgi:hypothetical protein